MRRQLRELRVLLVAPGNPVTHRPAEGEYSELEANRAETTVFQNAQGNSYANFTSRKVASALSLHAGSEYNCRRAMTSSSSNASSSLHRAGDQRGGMRTGRRSTSLMEGTTSDSANRIY